MLQMTINYQQRRTDETDAYGFPQRYQLHMEREKLQEMPAFAELRERFGRCEGKVYRETNATDVHCGYVFAKRERWYDQSIGWNDPRQFYTAETWVTFETVSVSPVDLSKV